MSGDTIREARAQAVLRTDETGDNVRAEVPIEAWRSLNTAVDALVGEAAARDKEIATLREIVRPFLARPRWLSIGSYHNTVEVRVSAEEFDRASALVSPAQPAEDDDPNEGLATEFAQGIISEIERRGASSGGESDE